MTPDPFFSVVIPTYNRAAFIKKTILSVLAQKFENFEIIIVDDGSTDNTEELVSDIRDRRLHYRKKVNAERAAARNFGAALAKGMYINFLDSDDLLYDNHMIVAHEFITKHHPAIFHLGYDVIVENGDVLRKVDNIRSVNDQILSGNPLSCNGVFIEKGVIAQNPFNEDRDLSSLEDWELWIRMSSRYAFMNANIVTSAIVQHDDRSVMTSNTDKIELKVNKFIDCVYADPQNLKVFGKKMNKAAASALTYASLHILLANSNKKKAFIYLLKGTKRHSSEVFKRRFLVIVFKLLFGSAR